MKSIKDLLKSRIKNWENDRITRLAIAYEIKYGTDCTVTAQKYSQGYDAGYKDAENEWDNKCQSLQEDIDKLNEELSDKNDEIQDLEIKVEELENDLKSQED